MAGLAGEADAYPYVSFTINLVWSELSYSFLSILKPGPADFSRINVGGINKYLYISIIIYDHILWLFMYKFRPWDLQGFYLVEYKRWNLWAVS